MDDRTDHAALARAVDRLAIGVWAVFAVLLISLGMSLYAFLFPDAYLQRYQVTGRHVQETGGPGAESRGGAAAPRADPTAAHRDFKDWPLERQLAAASIVARLEYEFWDPKRVRAVIAEFWKRDENVTFPYEVGDEFPRLNRDVRAGARYGDGVIAVIAGGERPVMRTIVYEDGRLRGHDDLPLSRLRLLARP